MNNETQILKDMKEWVMHGFGLMKLRPYCEFLDAVLGNDQWLPVYEKYQTTFAELYEEMRAAGYVRRP
ncbi:hypothetical protein [Faecalibaculum rodentium]|jgi:hypothetical protein|uniref:hypothetical protein n=1 Tax=Faecalibaculum rodentium TaxID=1702221 RepID=UPI00256EF77B|nr:hypothetical protein [Faecalibaculum rodentium]